MRWRPKVHEYVAAGLIGLAVLLYLARPAAPDARQWRPLEIPIELKYGSVQTPEFTAGLDTKYRLLIACERKIEFTRLECLLGMVDWQRAKTCADAAETIDIDWTVLNRGQFAAAGSSRDFTGGLCSHTVAREIGEFGASKGERYSFVLYIHHSGGELEATNPKLIVETRPWHWADAVEGYALASWLRSVGMLIFAAAGLLTLAGAKAGYKLSQWARGK